MFRLKRRENFSHHRVGVFHARQRRSGTRQGVVLRKIGITQPKERKIRHALFPEIFRQRSCRPIILPFVRSSLAGKNA